MKSDGFSYQFTAKELFYFLFKKKICPACGNIMKKEKTYEIVEGKKLNSKSDDFFIANGKIKNYIYKFKCPNCRKEYKLSELVKKN